MVPRADRAGRPCTGYSTRTRALERLGVVVGHLVRRQVGPHLQRAHARRRARASAGRARPARTGVAAAAAITTGGLRRSRRRSSGAARPAASTVQAAARMAVERAHGRARSIPRRRGRPGTGSRVCRRRSTSARRARRLGRRTRARRASAGRPPGATGRRAPSARPGSSIASTSSSSTLQPRRHDALAQRVDRLVVVRLGRVHAAPRTPARPASPARAGRRGRRCRRTQRAPVVGVADVVGQVLDQRPAERDVDQLHPAADARARGRSRSSARSASAISARSRSGAGVGRLRWRRVAVGGRVDVGAAGQHQRRRGRRARRPGARPTQASGGIISAIAPARLQRVDVGAREQERLAIPDRPARALERGAEADPGSALMRHRSCTYPASQPITRTHRSMTVQVAAPRRAWPRIELDRPEAMNAVGPRSSATTLRAAVEDGRRRRRRARRRDHRRGPGVLLRRRPARPASTRRRRAIPDVADGAARALPPDHHRHPRRCPSRSIAAVNGAGGGHRLLARARLRPRASPPSRPTSCSRS